MKVFRKSWHHAAESQRGIALLLAFLILIVIIAIVYQINTVTLTDEKVSHNEITQAKMDLAIESVLRQAYEDLKEDAQAAQAAEGEGEGGAAAQAGGEGGGIPGAPGGAGSEEAGEPPRNPDSVDSQMDRWHTPQSTNFDDIQLRIFIRDENSKYNVLNMLDRDEEQAEIAFQRVVRILDNARGGTDEDLSSGDAEEIARAMKDYMVGRSGGDLPSPVLLTQDVDNPEIVVPFSFAEFRALEVFEDSMFEDYFADEDQRIHGLQSFFTVFTSPAVGPEETSSGLPSSGGGYGVNVNTAPHAVLSGLFDSRDIATSVWDEIREYRNEEEDPLENEEDEGFEEIEPEPMLNEFGEEIFQRQIFDSLDELDELFDFDALNETEKGLIRDVLVVQSDVFEIIIAARLSTASDADERMEFESRREQEEYFRSGEHLVRIVRSVVWRRASGDEIVIVPLIRWEVLDNAPLQVLDYPDED